MALVLVSCEGCRSNEQRQKQLSYGEIEEQLIQQNKDRLASEKLDIESYILQKGWPMNVTGTGLRYWVYQDVEGSAAVKGDLVSIRFQVELLDGTLCYTSEAGKPFSFVVELDQVESGIHEGIQYMSLGDKARFILPSHLAWGVTGDQIKIPQNATLVYDIELIKLR